MRIRKQNSKNGRDHFGFRVFDIVLKQMQISAETENPRMDKTTRKIRLTRRTPFESSIREVSKAGEQLLSLTEGDGGVRTSERRFIARSEDQQRVVREKGEKEVEDKKRGRRGGGTLHRPLLRDRLLSS